MKTVWLGIRYVHVVPKIRYLVSAKGLAGLAFFCSFEILKNFLAVSRGIMDVIPPPTHRHILLPAPGPDHKEERGFLVRSQSI